MEKSILEALQPVLNRIMKVVMVASLSLSLTVVSGCTKYASQDDLNSLEEANKAAVSAEKELAKVEKERRHLENELSQKEGELADVKAEFEKVKTR